MPRLVCLRRAPGEIATSRGSSRAKAPAQELRAPRAPWLPVALWAGASWLASALAPVPASAWTDAAVRSVRAEVRVDREASAHVSLELSVGVHGGWLEALELAGLDPDLALDEAVPPRAEDAEGRTYRPTITPLRDGRLLIAFARPYPRRGRLTIHLAYRSSLAHRATEPLPDGRVRVRWTLPPWRAGLDGVEIALFVPPGSRPAPLEGAEGAIATEVEPGRDGTWIRFRRAHLPRTLAWTAAADVPAEALAQELRAARIAVPPPPRGAAERPRIDPSRAVLPVALLVLLLAWAKMAAMALAGRRGHAGPRPLVPLPVAARALLALAASAGAVVLARAGAGPALGLLAAASLLGAHRPHARVRPSRLGAWQPVDARFLRAARRARALEAVSPWSWLDATEPAGAVVLAASVALPWAAAHVGLTELAWPALAAASALPLPLLVTGTRRARPSSVARSLGLLLGAAAKLERLPPGVGLRPVVHVAADGRAQQARLRTTLAERPRGLLRLDLVVAHERHAGGLTPELALVVVTRASSPAERALAERLGAGASSPSGRRMLRMFAVGPEALEALERVAGALRDCPPAPAPDRGVAMEGETLRQLALPPAISI